MLITTNQCEFAIQMFVHQANKQKKQLKFIYLCVGFLAQRVPEVAVKINLLLEYTIFTKTC